MVFSWSVFLILQAFILLVYIVNRNGSKNHDFHYLYLTKLHYIVSNFAVLFMCYWFNTERQLFCNPVPWLFVFLAITIILFLSLPYLLRIKHKLIKKGLAVFGGVGIFIAFYLILFGRLEYLTFLLFNIPIILLTHVLIKNLNKRYQTQIFKAFYFYPAVVLAPFLILYQFKITHRLLEDSNKKLMIRTPVFILTILIFSTIRIHFLVNEIKQNSNNVKLLKLKENVIDEYLLDLIIGAHWKYGTELCLYDGWRPPFHDPVLVVANKILHPFTKFDSGNNYEESIELYKKVFPEKRTKFDCRCAKNERLFDFTF